MVELVTDIGYGLELDHCKDIVSGWQGLAEYVYILHDKDQTEVDGQVVPRKPHIHLAMRFNNPTPITNIQNRVTSVIGKECPSQWLEKVKSTWGEIVDYETHHDPKSQANPLKHTYDYAEAYTNINLELAHEAAEKSRAKREANKLAEEAKADIIAGIMDGRYHMWNLSDWCSPDSYHEYKSLIADTMEFRYKATTGIGREMDTIYIYGDSGSGKTTLAKEMAIQMGYDPRSIYISHTGNNPMDGYTDQEVVILDDIRSSVFRFAELLKILDPHTNTSVAARYYNKDLRNCKMIILTRCDKLSTFYENVTEKDKEQAFQLIRRITWNIYVYPKTPTNDWKKTGKISFSREILADGHSQGRRNQSITVKNAHISLQSLEDKANDIFTDDEPTQPDMVTLEAQGKATEDIPVDRDPLQMDLDDFDQETRHAAMIQNEQDLMDWLQSCYERKEDR